MSRLLCIQIFLAIGSCCLSGFTLAEPLGERIKPGAKRSGPEVTEFLSAEDAVQEKVVEEASEESGESNSGETEGTEQTSANETGNDDEDEDEDEIDELAEGEDEEEEVLSDAQDSDGSKLETEVADVEEEMIEGETEDPNIPKVNAASFRVREFEGVLELKTPFGEFIVPGKFGSKGMTHYKFAIPLEQLMDQGVEEFDEEDEEPEEESDNQEETPQDLAEQEVTPEATEPEVDKIEPERVPAFVEYYDLDKLFVEANYLFNRRRYFESLRVVDRILKKHPDNTRGWLMKGSLLYVQGHKDLALKSWNQALVLKPNDPEILSVIERYQ